MPRSENTYVVRPASESLTGWTATGEGLVNAFVGLEPNAFGTNGLAEGNNITSAANKKLAKIGWKLPTLVKGEIPVSIVGHAFVKSGASKDITFTFGPETGAAIFESPSSTAAAEWVKSVTINVAGKSLAATLARGEIETSKAAGGTVYAVYIVLTTVTESSVPVVAAQVGTVASANSEGSFEEGTNPGWVAGLTMIFKLATLGTHGAAGVTDSEGNTWVLDGEVQQGLLLNVQVWRAQLVKSLTGVGVKVKITGLPALAKIGLNFQPVFKILEPDVSATNTGTGTAMEVTTAATRAGQGDFATALFATNTEANFTPTAPFEADGGQPGKQLGLSVDGEWNRLPAEGSAITAKAAFSASGEWAAVLVLYKVLASTETTVAVLAMML